MAVAMTLDPMKSNAVERSIRSLRKSAGYQLPAELDRRILELGERKATLTSAEHAELLAWVEFTQQRTVEKLSAEVALKRLSEAFPEFDTTL